MSSTALSMSDSPNVSPPPAYQEEDGSSDRKGPKSDGDTNADTSLDATAEA